MTQNDTGGECGINGISGPRDTDTVDTNRSGCAAGGGLLNSRAGRVPVFRRVGHCRHCAKISLHFLLTVVS